MTRLDGWENRFQAVVEDWRARPFRYGETDCALFCAAVCEAITGNDPAVLFRRRYKTLSGAEKIREKHGGIETICDAYYRRISLRQAGRGDIVKFEKAIGICDANGGLFLLEGQGLVRIPLKKCDAAWRVE